MNYCRKLAYEIYKGKQVTQRKTLCTTNTMVYSSPNICDCYWSSSKSTITVRNWRHWWIAKRLAWTVDLLMSRSCACGHQERPARCEKQCFFYSNVNSTGMFHACSTILFMLKYAIKLNENGYINRIPSASLCGWHWIIYRWTIK